MRSKKKPVKKSKHPLGWELWFAWHPIKYYYDDGTESWIWWEYLYRHDAGTECIMYLYDLPEEIQTVLPKNKTDIFKRIMKLLFLILIIRWLLVVVAFAVSPVVYAGYLIYRRLRK